MARISGECEPSRAGGKDPWGFLYPALAQALDVPSQPPRTEAALDLPGTAQHRAQTAGFGLGMGLQQEFPLPLPRDGSRAVARDRALLFHRELIPPMMPKPLQASRTLDPGQQQGRQRGLSRQTLGLRACWAVWPSLVEHARAVFGVRCLHLAVSASSSSCPALMGGPGSADPSAAVPTSPGKPSQDQAPWLLHPKDAPRTPSSGPEAVLAAGSDQSPGQLSSDTFRRTESSILALTFPGDSWWLC